MAVHSRSSNGASHHGPFEASVQQRHLTGPTELLSKTPIEEMEQVAGVMFDCIDATPWRQVHPSGD